MKIRPDDAGIHGIDPHTLRREFQRGAARELIHSGLADAVCKNIRECPQARDAGDIHDVPFTFDDGR